jgi:hypothetical protein
MTSEIKVPARPSTEVAPATKNYFEQYGEVATQRNVIGRLLKFSKFGDYLAGQDEEKINHGTAVAAYMPSLSVGYMRWEVGKPVEYAMGPVGEGFVPPPRSELGHTDESKWDTFDDGRPRDPWQFSNALVLANLENDELFTFSTSSKGGLGAIGELAKTYGKRIRQKPDEVPIVELAVGSYQHNNRNYGEIRYPIFKVVGWVSNDKLPPLDGAPIDDDNSSSDEPAALPEPPPSKPAPPKAASPKARAGF